MRDRTLLALIACALLVAAQRAEGAPSAAPTEAKTPSSTADQTCIVGDTLTMRGDREPPFGPEMVADGHVRVTSSGFDLRGPHLDVYKSLHYGVFGGPVFGVDGLMAMMARRLTFELPDHELYLDGGKVVIKEEMKPEQLTTELGSNDPYTMFRQGKNGLTMTGDRVRRDKEGHYDAHNAWVTTCVCPDGCRPMLSASAVDAYIVPKQRTWLILPIYRIFNIPLLPMPVGSLPMKSRETGLLFPLFGTSGPGGYNIALPLFITLGDSADVTLSPFYFLGVLPNANLGGTESNSLGVRGPGGNVAFRWHPAVDSIGSLSLNYFYDTSIVDHSDYPHEYRGSREELQLTHSQGLLGGHAGLSGDLVSDGSVVADTSMLGSRQNESYLHSWAEYSRAIGSFNLSFDTNYDQALNTVPGACVGSNPCLLRTPLGSLPAVVSPVAELTASTANRAGPVMFEEELNLAYDTTWGGQPTENNPHPSRLIGGLSFAQTLPVARGRYGLFALETGERIQGTPDAGNIMASDATTSSGEAALRGGGYVGFIASTRIARTFANGWIHDFVPALQVRALDSWSQDSDNFGFAPGLYADRVGANLQTARAYLLGLVGNPLDMALPAEGTVQAIASLTTDLTLPKAAPMKFIIEEHPTFYQPGGSPLDPGQLLATLILPIGLNTISINGAYDLKVGDFTQGHAEYDRTLDFGTLKVGGAYLNGATSDQISRGLDTLFTPRFEFPNPKLPIPPGSTPQQYQAYAGVNFHFGPLGVQVNGGFTYYPTEDGLGGSIPAYTVQSYGATVSWSCEGCGKLAITFVYNHASNQALGLPPFPTPNYQFGDMRELTQSAQLSTFPNF